MLKSFKKLFIAASDVEESTGLLRIINTIQTNIAASLDPLIKNTQNDSIQLKNIELIAGQINIVNHKLNRILNGWKIVRIRGSATVYDEQDSNLSQNLTLWLHTTDNVVVDLEVF